MKWYFSEEQQNGPQFLSGSIPVLIAIIVIILSNIYRFLIIRRILLISFNIVSLITILKFLFCGITEGTLDLLQRCFRFPWICVWGRFCTVFLTVLQSTSDLKSYGVEARCRWVLHTIPFFSIGLIDKLLHLFQSSISRSLLLYFTCGCAIIKFWEYVWNIN